ncbi:MAG: hypothetical protein WDM80_05350 [Limisphaerales bacterium]
MDPMDNKQPETFFERCEREVNAAFKIHKKKPWLFWLVVVVLGAGGMLYVGNKFEVWKSRGDSAIVPRSNVDETRRTGVDLNATNPQQTQIKTDLTINSSNPQIGSVPPFKWGNPGANQQPGRLIIFYIDYGPKQPTAGPFRDVLKFRKDNHASLGPPLHVYPDIGALLAEKISEAARLGLSEERSELEVFSTSQYRKDFDIQANTERMGFFWEFLRLDAPEAIFELQDENKKPIASYDYSIR